MRRTTRLGLTSLCNNFNSPFETQMRIDFLIFLSKIFLQKVGPMSETENLVVFKESMVAVVIILLWE